MIPRIPGDDAATLLIVLSALALTCVGCVRPAPLVPNPAVATSPRSLRELSYQQLALGEASSFRFEKDDAGLEIDGYTTHFRAFSLPRTNVPFEIKVVTSTSFEVPHYPVKYLFAPRIVLLDAEFRIVYRSRFGHLKQKQRVFGEPRFELTHVVTAHGRPAQYLLIVREKAFDGRHVFSLYSDDSGLLDDQGREQRWRIQSSRTGPARVSLKQSGQ